MLLTYHVHKNGRDELDGRMEGRTSCMHNSSAYSYYNPAECHQCLSDIRTSTSRLFMNFFMYCAMYYSFHGCGSDSD